MTRRLTSLLLCLLVLSTGLTACNARSQPPAPEAPAPQTPNPAAEPSDATTPAPGAPPTDDSQARAAQAQAEAAALGLGYLYGRKADPAPRPGPYQPLRVQAAVPPYKVAADLSNLANGAQFGPFTAEQQRLLVQNGFFAAPSDFIQPFFLYENNAYWDLPSLVTTDSVLHTYHLFYDWSLRSVEYFNLEPDLRELTRLMLAAANNAYTGATTPNRKQAALDAAVYFGVASHLLALPGETLPAADPLIARELAKITAHAGREPTFLPYDIDYSSFVPRGHYTRTEGFQRYFRAMTWYGQVPFSLSEAETGPAALRATRAALLITTLLGPEAEQRWQQVYETTALFVGQADDVTPLQVRSLTDAALLADLESDASVRRFITKAQAQLPVPGISPQMAGIPSGLQLRFMGQRFVLDSAVLQKLVQWPERPIPTGLDLAAAWGSPRAKAILLNDRQEGSKWAEYPTLLQQQTERVAAVPQTQWQSNLYAAGSGPSSRCCR